MSEFRQNLITKKWVLIAPMRAQRPGDYAAKETTHKNLPDIDPECVFCPGNEYLNPDKCTDICRFPKESEHKEWQVRVVDNKFQALSSDVNYDRKGFYHARSGYGEHEVVIPRPHNQPIALQSQELIRQTFEVVQSRILQHSLNNKIYYSQVIYNHHKEAGASQVHPHYQILSLPLLPELLHQELVSCFNHYRDNSKCLYCDIIEQESSVGLRVVFETKNYIVFNPFAARTPFETWIVPKVHSSSFETETLVSVDELAVVMKRFMSVLSHKLNDPALNFYIHTLPPHRSKNSTYEADSFHWHITVFPRLNVWAGFEFSTGIPINSMPPEDAAAFLKA